MMQRNEDVYINVYTTPHLPRVHVARHLQICPSESPLTTPETGPIVLLPGTGRVGSMDGWNVLKVLCVQIILTLISLHHINHPAK